MMILNGYRLFTETEEFRPALYKDDNETVAETKIEDWEANRIPL